MDYDDIEDVYEFHRNMRQTPWLALFPHWWSENDALLKAIGDEVERIKAMSIFALLNAGIKPPVLLWQESIEHKEYHANFNVKKLPHSISIQAPLYKTWGKIILTNNTVKDIDGLRITLDDHHGIVINQLIAQSDKIVIDVTKNQVTLNQRKINVEQIDVGIPYFVTSRNNETYKEDTPLHNEVIRISFDTHDEDDTVECDIDVDVQLDNAVFTNEQNIEITGLEAVPIEKVELYAEYDFDFNKSYNGWHKVYEKKYDKDTNVVYDMITTQLYTKNFYVDVYFKTLQYPYKVGFPCFKDAPTDSPYHVNNRLDNWGVTLGLERRIYKENIPEKDYYYTYPIYYPFDIEQDYWYYKRLSSEYVWNNRAINDVDLLDTENNPIIRLYAIDPFIEDLVVHAKSTYPVEKEFTNYENFKPIVVSQKHAEGIGVQTEFTNIINILGDNEKSTSVTLNNKSDNNDIPQKREDATLRKKREKIKQEKLQALKEKYAQELDEKLTEKQRQIAIENREKDLEDSQALDVSDVQLTYEEKQEIMENYDKSIEYIKSYTHQSTQLVTYFDLSTLPSDINIDNIEVIVEGDSSDNKTNKYNTEDTAIWIPNYKGTEQSVIPLTADKTYQLKKQAITYSNKNLVKQLNDIKINDENIIQRFTIGEFEGKIKDFVEIPFTLTENNEIVDDITDIWVYYDGNIRQGAYKEKDGIKYIYVYVPNVSVMNEMLIVCKSKTHYPFTCKINIARANKYEEDTNKILYQYITGPLVDGEVQEEYADSTEWHTNNIRNLLQKQGLYFCNVIKNIDEQSSTTVRLYTTTVKITYSQKKSNFEMSTYIDRRNVEPPYIGTYNLSISNIGEKPLKTHVDIFSPPNIKLEQNSLDVDLNIGDSFSPTLKIAPNYPIDDGYYDITTICEDKILHDSIEVFSDGLIETGVSIEPHHGKYDDTISLKAEVHAVDKSIINGSVAKMQFYINGYYVGKTNVVNNKATLDISPGDYSFTGTGNLTLEARFMGTTKYASSSKRSTIFISKNDTRLTLIADSVAPYKGSFTLKAKVEYYNGETYLPIPAEQGTVEFYIDDEILSSKSTLYNGVFISSIDKIENPPGEYTLWAKYYGSNLYSATEESQPLEIVGGNVNVFVFDVNAKPRDIINLKAQVTDINNKTILNGYVDFYVKDINGNYVDFNLSNFNELTKNIEVNQGVATSGFIQLNEKLTSDLNNVKYTIEAQYHYSIEDDPTQDDLYQKGQNTGYINITKGEVELECQSVFYGTQYEPLGFYVKVINAATKEPVTDGTIELKLAKENVTLEESIDPDGIARFLYRPLEFTAKEWNELEKFSFTQKQGDLYKHYSGEGSQTKYVDFLYNEQDGTLHYVGNKPNETPLNDLSAIVYNANDGKYYINNQPLEERDVSEHVYITDGFLYARTTKDKIREYHIGTQDIQIKYSSDGQYKEVTKILENGLDIDTTAVDLDIHSYDLYYTDNEMLTCYVTKYSFTDNAASENIDEGSVQFTIDNNIIDTIELIDGKARLSNKLLSNISAGRHLIGVKYIPKNNAPITPTYSYSLLNLNKQKPAINVDIQRKTPGKSTKAYVTLSADQSLNVPLSGFVSLYLNNELIGKFYLNGNEQIPGIVETYTAEQALSNTTEDERSIYCAKVTFDMVIPEDIATTEYQLTALYEGNEFYLPNDNFDTPYILKMSKVDANINVKDNIYVGEGQSCFIDVEVEYYDDIINEGEVVLKYDTTTITSANVLNNKARLYWTPQASLPFYTLTYQNADNYNDKIIAMHINVISPLPEISIPNPQQSNIEEALMCLQPEGTIYITDDILITKDVDINKNCHIIGENDTSIIKDITDLFIDDLDLYVYTEEDVSDMFVFPIKPENLNKKDYKAVDRQLFIKTKYTEIPLYYAEDGKFYTPNKINNYSEIVVSDTYINIKPETSVTFDNLTFTSNDNQEKAISDFAIFNEGNCVITHSIIQPNTQLVNKGTLTAHRNLIYGNCIGDADLDNNWWGTNTAPYNVNNNIILQVSSNGTPAVISEECEITGSMIGANGQYYDIPQAEFKFTADTGYFSIDSGKITNQKITTIYLDAEKEGNVYFTVDNEQVAYPIYNYERKTEVIIDDIEDILLGYQTTITAKVQSAADVFYEFDKNNNVIKNTKLINEGSLTFYIEEKDTHNKQQIGYTPVINGEGSIKLFLAHAVYKVNTDYTIYAEYKGANEYFDSLSTVQIHTITEDDVCFISKDGNDNDNGTYGAPVATFSRALSLNKNTIYILSGNYAGNKIQIDKNITIKKYNGTVTFTELNGESLFEIHSNKTVNIIGIDFIGNNFNYLINNSGSLSLINCIFYKNKGTLFKNSMLATSFNVSLSAIVDNENIADNINPHHYSKCWFGTNTPNNNLDNYIIMTYEQSKSVIYIGTLAHVTAQLTSYSHNRTIYKLEENIPLRIAKFATEIGSVKPIKDYTYNNKSTSLVNTLASSNTTQYILSLKQNIFYDQHPVNIECNIQDVYGDNIKTTNQTLKIHIVANNVIDIKKDIDIIDGIASYNMDILPIGRYYVYCTYINNQQTYTLSTYFDVQPLDIIIDNFNIDDNSHLYYTKINAIARDNFNNNINKELINIDIDGVTVAQTTIIDGVIDLRVQYNLLQPGQHNLTLHNKGITTQYGSFYYETPLIVSQQKTNITFDYDTLELNVNNNLVVEVNDGENKEVQTGYITVEFDDKIIEEKLFINNGIAVIDSLNIKEKGQHSIVLYYNDNHGYYQSSSYVKSDLGVGVFNVFCSIADIIEADISKDLQLSMQFTDIGHQNVDGGYVDILIDDDVFSENNKVNNGNVNISQALPDGIASGMHRLTIVFSRNQKYLDTYFYSFLNVGQIATEIGIVTVSGASGLQTTVKYNINSFYGAVNVGQLSAYFNDNGKEVFLNTSPITDSIINEIAFTTPLLPAGDEYQITFKYHDDNNNYKDSQVTRKLIIDKSKVKITPATTWYYPQQDFNLSVDIRDLNDHIIDDGKIDVYIDNVKEKENINVVNGQAIVPLYFNNARNYSIDIVYKDNDYYSETHYPLEFSVTNIEIDKQNVSFAHPLEGLPNTTHTNEIIFNMDGYNVKDGVIDILFDNNNIGNFYISENNKNIQFDIGPASKGTHTLLIKYYGSTLFKDFEKEFDFEVIAQQVDLRINMDSEYQSQNIDAISSDTICIQTSIGHYEDNTWTAQPITGIINYYLMIPQYKINELGQDYIDGYYSRFIGAEEFNDESSHEQPYEYILTTDLLEYIADNLETHYKIRAKFIGNNKYDPSSECIDLNIHKQGVKLILSDQIQAEYQDEIELNILMLDVVNDENVIGGELIEIYIDNEYIGTCNLRDGEGVFKYRLNNKYTIGTYTITAKFNGSAVNEPKEQETILSVQAFTPVLETEHLDVYIGGQYTLDAIIKDKNGAIINSGELKYTIDNDRILTTTPTTPLTTNVPIDIKDNWNINVEYISEDLTKYNNFNKTISVNMIKNPIKLSLDMPNTFYRGEPIPVQLTATSETTNEPINLSFTYNGNTYEMHNNHASFSLTYPLDTTDEFISGDFITEGNDIFEGNQTHFRIRRLNREHVTVDKTIPQSSTNAHTLAKAIDLVDDYGTIELISSFRDETINQLDKNVTIKGNVELINCSITNKDKKLTIKGITIRNNEHICIHNESILTIEDCKFIGNAEGVIYTDGAATICNCKFSNNRNDNGGCIYVANKNYKTSIIGCTFNANTALLYGGCIYSNKVNDMEILDNEFSKNNRATNGGSCIYAYGNITVSSNTFYDNTGKNQIYLLRGECAITNNLFDGKIQSISVQQGTVIDADFNYWGYNNINTISQYNPGILIDNYLIGYCEFYNEDEENYVVCRLNKYINRLEKEITTINILDKTFPVIVGNKTPNINEGTAVQDDDIVQIGQNTFSNGITLSSSLDIVPSGTTAVLQGILKNIPYQIMEFYDIEDD